MIVDPVEQVVADREAGHGRPGPARTEDPAGPIWEQPFDALLERAVAFHGHLCPGQVLGVRMVMAGCRQLGLAEPRRAGKALVAFVEIDRCATDAVQALTGVSVGRRTLKHLDFGKMAVTFVDVGRDAAVRVTARDDARAAAPAWAPDIADPRRAQVAAYRLMPEALLLRLEPVRIEPGWLDRPRVRVFCDDCGEGINYRREVTRGGRILCRPCAGEAYYSPATGAR